MPAVLLIERRDADEPVDAAFALEQPVRVVATDEERDRLEARLLGGRLLGDLCGKSLCVRPAQIHARKHLRPVGGVDAAGAGVVSGDRAVVVVLAVEVGREFERVDGDAGPGDQAVHLVAGSRFVAEDRQRLVRIREEARDPLELVDLAAHVGQLLHDPLRGFGVVPEIGRARALIELGYLALFANEVKDAPRVRPGVRAGAQSRRVVTRSSWLGFHRRRDHACFGCRRGGYPAASRDRNKDLGATAVGAISLNTA